MKYKEHSTIETLVNISREGHFISKGSTGTIISNPSEGVYFIEFDDWSTLRPQVVTIFEEEIE